MTNKIMYCHDNRNKIDEMVRDTIKYIDSNHNWKKDKIVFVEKDTYPDEILSINGKIVEYEACCKKIIESLSNDMLGARIAPRTRPK